MKIIRVLQVWTTSEDCLGKTSTYLSLQGMQETAGIERPCIVDTKTIQAADGITFEASIFWGGSGSKVEPVCLIPYDAPKWAEAALEKLLPNPYPARVSA